LCFLFPEVGFQLAQQINGGSCLQDDFPGGIGITLGGTPHAELPGTTKPVPGARSLDLHFSASPDCFVEEDGQVRHVKFPLIRGWYYRIAGC
jgi:hypothetical protein